MRQLNTRRLAANDYHVLTAGDGEEALAVVSEQHPDLLVLDVVLPKLDGLEVCRRLRADASLPFIPIILVTARGDSADVVAGLDAGADEYLAKPVDHAALLARVRSMLRIKELHDTVREQTARLEAQALQLAEWNRILEARVDQQVTELERLGRLRRFLSAQIADLLVSTEGEALLESHRRQIAVVSCKLHGFAETTETSTPEELMAVLHEYYAAVNGAISAAGATIGPLNGDQLMLFFNDPLPVDDPAADAVHLALTLRERLSEAVSAWGRAGFGLGFVAGIDLGYATLGMVGLEGRTEYGPLGPVVPLASRLRDAARPGEILISQRVLVAVDRQADTTARGEVMLPGAGRSTLVFAVERVRTGVYQRTGAHPRGEGGAPLSAREREVVGLIAQGYSNRQIAEALVIAEATAVRHVANILNKLDMNSRARVAAWAVSHGLASTGRA